MSGKSRLVDIDDVIHQEDNDTELAYCVSKDEDTFEEQADRIYLPKKLVELDNGVFTMPEWLALDKGLI